MVNFAIRNTRLGRSVTIDQCLNIGVCVRVCMCVCMCVCVPGRVTTISLGLAAIILVLE